MNSNPLMNLPLTPEDWEQGRTWYTLAADRIDTIARKHGVDPDVARAVFAAVSPGMRIEPNTNWLNVILGGWNVGDEKPANYPVPYGWAPFKLATLIRDTGDVSLLTGQKRLAFLENLRGNLDVVTVDTWALKPFGLKSVGKRQHKIVSDAYTAFAHSTGHKPAEAQAAVWVHLRGRNW